MAAKPVSAKAKSAKASAKKTPNRVGSARGARSGKVQAAEKRPEGRPAKFTVPASMAEKIDGYFASLYDDDGTMVRPPTVAGLALALGFLDRSSISDYAAKDEYFPLIKKARLRIEAFHEGRMSGQSPAGSIFWLKNHAGYADKQELTGANGGPLVLKVSPVEAAL